MKKLLEVELRGLPPTVNHLYRTGKNGTRYKTVMGKLYQDYATLVLSNEWHEQARYPGSVELRLTLTSGRKRKWDLDNRVKALQDCLELAGVIEDDAQIEVLHVERATGRRTSTRLEMYAR